MGTYGNSWELIGTCETCGNMWKLMGRERERERDREIEREREERKRESTLQDHVMYNIVRGELHYKKCYVLYHGKLYLSYVECL